MHLKQEQVSFAARIVSAKLHLLHSFDYEMRCVATRGYDFEGQVWVGAGDAMSCGLLRERPQSEHHGSFWMTPNRIRLS